MLLIFSIFTLFSLTASQCIGPCIGACPTGYACISGACCPNTPPAPATTLPPTIPTIPTVPTVRTTTTTPATVCQDTANNCAANANLCSNSVYYTLMTQQCARTCGRCSSSSSSTSTTCVDLVNPSTGVSDCPSRAYLCNNSVYYTLMTQQCPRTCGRCSSTSSASSTCTNVASNCPSLSYLCSNSAYYTLMTQQCALTCGRCSG